MSEEVERATLVAPPVLLVFAAVWVLVGWLLFLSGQACCQAAGRIYASQKQRRDALVEMTGYGDAGEADSHGE